MLNRKKYRKNCTRKQKKKQHGGNKNTTTYPPDTINLYISSVIYINLDKRTDRKDEIVKELKIFNPEKIHRVSAVFEPDRGYLACTKSHLKALKKAKKHNWENVLIVEDDAKWENIEKGFPVFEKLVKEPYDVIMLGGTFAEYDHTTYSVKKAQSSASYIVNRKYYDTIIQKYKEVLAPNEDVTPDVQVFQPLQAKDNWFIVSPALMIQRKSYSDIQKGNVNYKNLFA
jgi:glycosyl transferase family 25